ncbi:MAG: PRC-barrel domain-containing protein [Dehalococcoidales bacterium]|nr:PRC-barrel domain-containing protein [Dehalococcoidales bacterium]
MEIEYGAEVRDKNGKVLGTVNKVIRDSWTGEISKFQVTTDPTEVGFFIPPQNIDKATPKEIKLNVALEEL